MNNKIHQNENWILWNPDRIESSEAFSTQITQDKNGTRFTVECMHQFIDLIFDGFVPIYLYSYEGIRPASYVPVQQKNNDKYYFKKWFLYKIENSDFLNWAAMESYNLYQNYDLQHFCIVTEDDVVDILSSVEPKIVVTQKDI
jgi:hypothetical protein